jgi:RES domain-containing protein
MHKRKYRATDAGGSLRVSGRYNRGRDLFPEEEVWPALYLALSAEVCIGEIVRHITPALLPLLNDYRLSELAVTLPAVIDCRAVTALDSIPAEIRRDSPGDYDLSQSLAAAVRARGAVAIVVPSATRLGDNLIIFPDRLRGEASLEVVSERDPVLYIPRP